MYWVDRSTGEIVSERDKNKPLWAYYEYLRGYWDGVVIENYIIGENPFFRIDFAYCVGDKYVNLKRDCHFICCPLKSVSFNSFLDIIFSKMLQQKGVIV